MGSPQLNHVDPSEIAKGTPWRSHLSGACKKSSCWLQSCASESTVKTKRGMEPRGESENFNTFGSNTIPGGAPPPQTLWNTLGGATPPILRLTFVKSLALEGHTYAWKIKITFILLLVPPWRAKKVNFSFFARRKRVNLDFFAGPGA